MNHKKYCLRLSFFATFPLIPRHRDSPKISEDSRKIVFSRDLVCLRVSLCSLLKTLKSKSAIFYIIISKKYTILKGLQGLSETSRTHTQLNQNTGEDFLEKVIRFYASVFGVFRNTSSKWSKFGFNKKFMFSSKYFSQAKVPEKYGSQEIQC